jgi:hypothetical protein
MKVLVCGSRGWNDRELLDEALAEYDVTLIIEGDARGADRMAGQWARDNGVELKVMPANWNRYGRSAGYRRNIEMLEQEPDLVVALWDGQSRGTLHTIKEARKRHIETIVVTPT